MLTKFDLKAIDNILDRRLDPIKADIRGVRDDIDPIKKDIRNIQNDLGPIKENIRGIQKDLDPIGKDIRKIQKDLRKTSDTLDRENLKTLKRVQNFEKHLGIPEPEII